MPGGTMRFRLTKAFAESSLPEQDGDMAAMVEELVREFEKIGDTRRSINYGSCGEFAYQLQTIAGGTVYRVGFHGETEYGVHLPAHVFLKWRGKFYDSESPNGVHNWRRLKTFALNGVKP